VSGMQKIVSSSPALQQFQSFRNVMNLGAVDVLATRLWCDRKVEIPRPSNACFGFDQTTGWTFFDLNALHDEFQDESGTVIEADFYHANQFLPLDDSEIIAIVQRYLATCVPAFRDAQIVDSSVIRLPKAVTHFSPGSYQNMLRVKTNLSNLFMSGDWIINQHGSWSQEKAYVTGLEAANQVINRFGIGSPAVITPVETDEPHIQFARTLNRTLHQWGQSVLPNFWLP
jgi:uncharacterized protein with NAD-binding domain and iron-sulfur cluster